MHEKAVPSSSIHSLWYVDGLACSSMLHYFATLGMAKRVLWCYLIWYLCIISFYFDASPVLWASSLGMSGIIGTALLLSTVRKDARPDGWTVFRLFLMPFCVSSYSALIKGKGFILIFPPVMEQNLAAFSCILLFLFVAGWLRHSGRENGLPG